MPLKTWEAVVGFISPPRTGDPVALGDVVAENKDDAIKQGVEKARIAGAQGTVQVFARA